MCALSDRTFRAALYGHADFKGGALGREFTVAGIGLLNFGFNVSQSATLQKCREQSWLSG